MPELSSIQTYEKIEGLNFRPTLNRFCKVLKGIDLWNDEIKRAFENFHWKIEDNGFVYQFNTDTGYYISKFSGLKMRPIVTGYTPAIDNTFKDNWIGCELLIETNELRSFFDNQYRSYTFAIIKALTLEMQKEFKQTGVYFTDEAQDGSDFEGIRCKNPEKIWQFNYALIPLNLSRLYLQIPITHHIKQHKNYIEAWYFEKWNESSTH